MNISPGEAHIGEIGGNSSIIKVQPVLSLTQYTSGDAVGGRQVLTNALRTVNGSAILQSLTILDRDNLKLPMELLIFSANPTVATLTDNAPVVLSTDDAKVIAHFTLAAADYVTVNSKGIASYRGVNTVLKGEDNTANLYAVLVATGNKTHVSTSAIVVNYGLLRD